jgi:hypothetical protein
VLAACGGTASIPAAHPRANEVKVGKADPPPGSTDLGPIEAAHGQGCGLFGEHGSLEGAMVALRNVAAQRNANYVALLSTTEPHADAGCYDDRFVIRGIAYRVFPRSPAAPASVATDGCDPPCSPGYRCSQAFCVALCNPACGPDQVCRQDRTCGPVNALPAPPR